MELLNNLIKEKEANRKAKKEKNRPVPWTERRVVTRKIMRNKLKFELKKLGYTKVNKNFKSLLLNMDMIERLKLLNK